MVDGCGGNLKDSTVIIQIVETSTHYLSQARGLGVYHANEVIEYDASAWSRNDKVCGEEWTGMRCYHLECARRGGLIW